MKRIIYSILFSMTLCLLLAGCKDKDVGSLGDNATGNTQASSDDKSEEPVEKKEEKKDDTITAPASDEDVEEDEKDDIGYEDIYEPVLMEARDVINNGYDPDRDYEYLSTGIMERVMYPGDDNLSEVLGYYYKDCNGDDIPELLIGENDEDYTGSNPNDIAYIYSGYTCIDGKPACFLEGWARNRQHYMGDGRFLNSGSSGAMNYSFGEWHLSKDGAKTVWDDFYFTLEDAASGEMVLFHNTTGNEEPGDSERLKISEDEFLEIGDRYTFKCGAIAWTPLGPRDNGGRYIVNTMTDDELLKFEKKLNSIENYGFLLSTYSEPRAIYWDEVFYCGAGINLDRLTPEMEKAYLKAAGQGEIYTDLTVIPGKELKRFIKDKTGFDYSEMYHPLDWIYLKEQDLYMFEHGDTNQIPIEVRGGQVEKGEYTITYLGRDGLEYCVTFRDEGGTYRFISNLPRWMVEDPTNGGDIDYSDSTEGMIIPDSDSRKLTDDDLKNLDIGELRLARNEIYARHGRIFTSEDLQTHFGAMDWYMPSVEAADFDEKVLNEYEKYNLELISKYEKKLKK